MSAVHTIHMPDGTRIEVSGDRYEIHLAHPIVVHRRHWIRSFTATEEVRRTIDSTASDPISKALEHAFRTIPQTVYGDDEDRHHDRSGYCDNPSRGY